MKNKQGIQLAFNIRHQNGQQFMTFARIFIANGIDKIHTLSNESALPLLRGASALGGSADLKQLAWARGDRILCSFIKNWYQKYILVKQ
ncbi:MAG: hypothetical protein RMY34_05645 [Aulosira sp. DedQUE10]|nr:hypothetical protein [Aulosira sp. DedQUE10]